MLTMKQLRGVRVWQTKTRRNGEVRRTKLGKLKQLVFSPKGTKVVGFLVHRPDIAAVIKREDVFLALDAFEVIDEGILASKGDASFDDVARERLSISWDNCLLWDGMDVKTKSGKELGLVDDVVFDGRTGRVKEYLVSDGGMAEALVGQVSVPAKYMLGYKDGWMIVDDAVSELGLTGGLAGKAGAAVGKAQVAGKKVTKQGSRLAAEAFDKGTHSLGRGITKARRAISDLMEEDPDEPQRLEEALVEDAEPRKLNAASTTKTTKKTYKGSGKKKKRNNDSVGISDKAAKTVGRQLGKTRSMFAAFKEEFDKNSK